jgi:hypothetical protein
MKKLKYKKRLIGLFLILLCVILFPWRSIAATLPPQWDIYSHADSGILESIYNDSSSQKEFDKYDSSYTIVDGFGAANEYTNLTIDSTKKIISSWFNSAYGPFLYYAQNTAVDPEKTSIDFNNQLDLYGNAEYAYIGSNTTGNDLADAKAAAMVNQGTKVPPLFINMDYDGLSPRITSAMESHEIKNAIVLGGKQRFDTMFEIGNDLNIVRIGGENRTETLNYLRAAESAKNKIYDVSAKPTVDENGVICDIKDQQVRVYDVKMINDYLKAGNFESAATYLLNITHGTTGNINTGNYAALIGCDNKFLKTYYVKYNGDYQYGVYQYIGKDYFPENDEDPEPPTNNVPVATVSAPPTVYVGDDVRIDGTGTSNDTTITSLTGEIRFDDMFGVNEIDLNPETKEFTDITQVPKDMEFDGTVWFEDPGTYEVYSHVKDSRNASDDSDSVKILAKVPFPSISIKMTGTNKENRKFTISLKDSDPGSKRAKMDWSKTKWTITPVSGVTSEDIRIQKSTTGSTNGEILYDPSRGINKSLDGMNILDFTVKKPGEIKIFCVVENEYGKTDSQEYSIGIQPDLAPTANHSTPTTIIRDINDPAPNGYAQATVTITDNSSSSDDVIAKKGYLFVFDTNNDNNYDNETVFIYDEDYNGSNQMPWNYSLNPKLRPLGLFKDRTKFSIDDINTGSLKEVNIKTTHVGSYLVGNIVKEEFKEEFIPQFTTSSDRKSAMNFE